MKLSLIIFLLLLSCMPSSSNKSSGIEKEFSKVIATEQNQSTEVVESSEVNGFRLNNDIIPNAFALKPMNRPPIFENDILENSEGEECHVKSTFDRKSFHNVDVFHSSNSGIIIIPLDEGPFQFLYSVECENLNINIGTAMVSGIAKKSIQDPRYKWDTWKSPKYIIDTEQFMRRILVDGLSRLECDLYSVGSLDSDIASVSLTPNKQNVEFDFKVIGQFEMNLNLTCSYLGKIYSMPSVKISGVSVGYINHAASHNREEAYEFNTDVSLDSSDIGEIYPSFENIFQFGDVNLRQTDLDISTSSNVDFISWRSETGSSPMKLRFKVNNCEKYWLSATMYNPQVRHGFGSQLWLAAFNIGGSPVSEKCNNIPEISVKNFQDPEIVTGKQFEVLKEDIYEAKNCKNFELIENQKNNVSIENILFATEVQAGVIFTDNPPVIQLKTINDGSWSYSFDVICETGNIKLKETISLSGISSSPTGTITCPKRSLGITEPGETISVSNLENQIVSSDCQVKELNNFISRVRVNVKENGNLLDLTPQNFIGEKWSVSKRFTCENNPSVSANCEITGVIGGGQQACENFRSNVSSIKHIGQFYLSGHPNNPHNEVPIVLCVDDINRKVQNCAKTNRIMNDSVCLYSISSCNDSTGSSCGRAFYIEN